MGAVQKLNSDDQALAWYRCEDREIVLADAVNDSSGSPMSIGFGRYSAGEANDWTCAYHEALIITKGRVTVRSDGGSLTATAGEVFYLPAGTTCTYQAEEESELVFVTYPNWLKATLDSPYAADLEQWQPA